MSGVDPLSSAALAASLFNPPAAELAILPGDAQALQALQALLNEGDVVAAKILPPANGADRMEIAGRIVTADLPPSLRPGDTILLQVVEIDGGRVITRNLGLEVAPEAAPSGAPAARAPAANPQLGAAIAKNVTPGTPAQANPSSLAAQVQAAPSAAVFVKASVRPAAPEQGPPVREPPTAGTATPRASGSAAAVPGAPEPESPAASARPAAPAGPPLEPSVADSLEARIAASRAAPVKAGPANSPTPVIPPRPAAPLGGARSPQPAQSPVSPVQPRAASQSAQTPYVTLAQTLQNQSVPKEVRALLGAVDVPPNATTIAAARLGSDAPAQVPNALAVLERALAPASADPRIATLKTLLGFLSRLDPAHETFAAQLSAYISHVIEGPEPKLLALLAAYAARDRAAAGPVADNPDGVASAASGRPDGSPETQTPAPLPAVPLRAEIVEARIAERTASIEHDLKTLLLHVAQTRGAGPDAANAAQSALNAVTGTQLATLLAARTDPQAITLSIPLPFLYDQAPARIRIDREASKGGPPLNADNFHVAFVLDTRHLGTVAIDLETVGRAVKVAVKTERSDTAGVFREELGRLESRLEHLRYRVSAASADVARAAPHAETPASVAPVAPAPGESPNAATLSWDFKA